MPRVERDRLFLDADPVACAAMACAAKEDEHHLQRDPGHSRGSSEPKALPRSPLAKWDKVGAAADQIISAVTKLDDAGFHGPYCMGLAPAQYNLLLRRYPQGDGTELDHIRTILGGDVVKAPVLKKGGVLLASGRQVLFARDRAGHEHRVQRPGRGRTGVQHLREPCAPHPGAGVDLRAHLTRPDACRT